MQRIITYIFDERFWREGKAADVWTVTHFLFGVIGALTLLLVGFSPATSFVALFLAAVAWEAFEYAVDIKETLKNRILDVAITLVGFAGGYFISLTPPPTAWAALVALSLLWGFMIFIGWNANRKRIRTLRG